MRPTATQDHREGSGPHRALKAARLEPPFRFHDLRHSVGTAMAGAGVPIRTLMAWMGHEDMQTTLIYAHYAPNPAEVDMVDRAFDRRIPLGASALDRLAARLSLPTVTN
jgi:integrase